jgi:hypothetical protein
LHDYNFALGFFVSREKESRKEEKKTYNVGRRLAIYIYIYICNQQRSYISRKQHFFFYQYSFVAQRQMTGHFFEGAEKLLEIWFTSSTNEIGKHTSLNDLRNIPR